MNSQDSGNPTGVMTVATVGIVTALVQELIKSGALQPASFLAALDELAAIPLESPQTPDENRMEKKVFDLVRQAAKTVQQEAP